MTSPRVTWDISLGTIIHLIGMIVIAAGAYYGIQMRTSQLESQFASVSRSTVRIERYLSSKDSEYWQRVKTLDDDPK